MIQDVEEIFDLTGSDKYQRLFRINHNGLRLYVKKDPFTYYSGLTGALSRATFKGDIGEKILNDWRSSMIDSFGKKQTDDYVRMTADFGTLLHQGLVTIKDNKEINWNEEKDRAESYFLELFTKTGQPTDGGLIKQVSYEYMKHLSSMMQFIFERVDKIHAIEVPVIWEELKIATPIDLICSCRQTPKGDFKETVINVKTSKQITPKHFEQVACELTMHNQTYENHEAEYSGILRTTDWRESSGPTYDYKYIDLMEALELSGKAFKRLVLCLEDSRSTYYPNPTTKTFEGVTKLGEKPEVKIKSLNEDWLDYWTNDN
jgi:hypothetical protein